MNNHQNVQKSAKLLIFSRVESYCKVFLNGLFALKKSILHDTFNIWACVFFCGKSGRIN